MLGGHFSRLLKQRNIPFVGSDRKVDIANHELVESFISQHHISHIINCAAYTQVDKAESEREISYLINAKGVGTLATAANKHGCHLIHFSTDYVFDGKGSAPYFEDNICSPINAYGFTKWEGEKQLFAYTENACIIRTSWLFGYPGHNFVETMLKLMQEREVLRVVDDQKGRPTYCQDLAEAALHLLDKKGIYHFANEGETTWYQFADEIRRQAVQRGFSLKLKQLNPITTAEYPTPARRPAYSTLSTTKIEALLGQPIRPWQEALNDYMKVK